MLKKTVTIFQHTAPNTASRPDTHTAGTSPTDPRFPKNYWPLSRGIAAIHSCTFEKQKVTDRKDPKPVQKFVSRYLLLGQSIIMNPWVMFRHTELNRLDINGNYATLLWTDQFENEYPWRLEVRLLLLVEPWDVFCPTNVYLKTCSHQIFIFPTVANV